MAEKIYRDLAEAIRRVVEYQPERRRAKLGYVYRGEYTIVDPDDQRFYFARFSDGGFVRARHYGKISPIADADVIVVKEKSGHRLEPVLNQWESGENTNTDAGVGYHTHRRGSTFEYEVDTWLLSGMRATVDNGLVISIARGFYKQNGVLRYFAGDTIDLTANVPSTSLYHRYVVVGMDVDTATLTAYEGAETFQYVELDEATIDDIDIGSDMPLFAVTLTNAQTEIVAGEIIDLRFMPFYHTALSTASPVTVTLASDAGSISEMVVYCIIAAQTGTADDLSTLTVSGKSRLLLLQADAGDTITVKHNVGNIKINRATDIVLSGDKTLMLFWDGTNLADVGAYSNTLSEALNFNGYDANAINWLNFDDGVEVTISGGVLAVTQTWHRIDTEADGATDDIETITGGTDGCLLIVRAENAARTVVLKHGVGNIQSFTAEDVVLDESYKAAILIYDAALSKWLVIGGGGNAIDAFSVAYTPTTPGDWDSVPGNVGAALNELASMLAALATSGTLAGLTDVDFSTPPTDGQVLGYHAASSKWKPVNMTGGPGGVSDLDDLTDVDLTTPPTDGQILIFDAADNQFKPGDLPPEYVATNTDLVYRKQIARTVLGSDTAQFDFDLTALGAVAAAYDRLIIRGSLRSSAAATSDVFRIFFNADYTVANYRGALEYGGNSTSGSGATTPDISWADGNTAPTGSFTDFQMEIENPFSSSTIKKAQGILAHTRSTTEAYNAHFSVVRPGSNASLTQITFRLDGYSTDVFKAGSWIEVIGEKNGSIPVTLVTSVAMNDLTDVNTSGIADGDVLLYDAGTSTFLPGEAPGNYVTKKTLRTYELIQEYEFSSPLTSSPVFTLPQTYEEIYIEFEGRSDGAVTHSRLRAAFNGDTTNTNYWWQYAYGAASVTVEQVNNRFIGGYVMGTSASNWNIPTRLGMLFELYSSGVYQKRVAGWMGRHYATNYEAVGMVSTIWRNTAPITTVQFEIETGYNFIVGSKFKIWGVKNREVVVDGRAPDSNPTPPKKVVTFEIPGTQALVAKPTRIYNVWSQDYTIEKVHIAVDTAPTGSSFIVDVNKNGSTIFTTQANRPTIADGAYTGQTTTINVAGFNQGDYLQIDVDQIGSTIAGANLVVQIVMS